MALSKYESTRDTTNLARIARIILCPCTDLLQNVLTKQITPSELKRKSENLMVASKAYTYEEELIRDFSSNYSELSIPMLYLYLSCICAIPPHKNRWGYFPDEKDRSLSANVDRIYCLHKKYSRYPYNHLEDSNFEQEWTTFYHIVKELEEYIGSGTDYQDTLAELKIRSIDPDVEKVLIESLRRSDNNHVENILESLKRGRSREEDCMEIFNVERTPHMMDLELEEMLWRYHFSGTDDTPQKIDVPNMSKKLIEKLNSFNVEFPVDHLEKSLARGILQDDILDFVGVIKKLSKGILLTTEQSRSYTAANEAFMFQVFVFHDGDQFNVLKLNDSPNSIKDISILPEEDCRTKIIFITSKSLPVIKAKLVVYQKYKHAIKERNILLQHEYEEFDDVVKTVAYRNLMSFCTFVESVINFFTIDLYKIITDYENTLLTPNEVREMCYQALKNCNRKQENYGIAALKSHRFVWVADKIMQKLSVKGELMFTDVWDRIKDDCRKTVEDLKVIISGLEDFGTKVLQVNQNKQIEEWLKREVIKDSASLHKHPSIIKYIAGQRNDKTNVVKIFLSENDDEAKEYFIKSCVTSYDRNLEFVNVEETNEEMRKEVEEIKDLERKARAIDPSTRKTLKEIIQKDAEKIYAKYSNVIGIRIGKFRRVDGDILEQPCIILYCLDKTLIPFGENPLPETLSGWPCDIREDFIMLGKCTQNCKTSREDFPELGCSIGMPLHEGSGSVGFFYRAKNSKKLASGFLTASHVAVKNCHELHRKNKLLSNHSLGTKTHCIVHPSWKDSGRSHTVGHVVESFYGNYKSSNEMFAEGLDFAVVKTKQCRKEEEESITVVRENDITYKEMVMKTGRTTETRYGYLTGEIESVKIEQPPHSELYYGFNSLYVVDNMDNDKPFFKKGDSGSGVFIVEEQKPDKALGIGIALSKNSHETYVCKIDKILKNLELDVVTHFNNNRNQTDKDHFES